MAITTSWNDDPGSCKGTSNDAPDSSVKPKAETKRLMSSFRLRGFRPPCAVGYPRLRRVLGDDEKW